MHPRGAYAQGDRRLLRKPCWETQRLARASFVRRLEVKDIGFHAVGLQGLGFRVKPHFPPTRVKGYLPHIPSKQKTTRSVLFAQTCTSKFVIGYTEVNGARTTSSFPGAAVMIWDISPCPKAAIFDNDIPNRRF